jgi:hypothetical protein
MDGEGCRGKVSKKLSRPQERAHIAVATHAHNTYPRPLGRVFRILTPNAGVINELIQGEELAPRHVVVVV